jgi:acyl carrier protein
MAELIKRGPAYAAVVPFDARQLSRAMPQAGSARLLSRLVASSAGADAAEEDGFFGDGRSVRAELAAMVGGGRRRQALEALIRRQIAAVLRLDPARIARDATISSFGFDSLMALELRNRLETAMALKLSATLIWAHPTIGAMAEHLAEQAGVDLSADGAGPVGENGSDQERGASPAHGQTPARGAPEQNATAAPAPEQPGAGVGLEALLESLEELSDEEASAMLTASGDQKGRS